MSVDNYSPSLLHLNGNQLPMDPNSTDPNNPSGSVPTTGGQPDLSSTTLSTNPVDTNQPVTPSFNTTPTNPDQSWSTLPQQPSTGNASIWTPPTTTPADINAYNPTSSVPLVGGSSLDNPFNVPTQPPTIDGGLPPMPTTMPESALTPPTPLDTNPTVISPQTEAVTETLPANPNTAPPTMDNNQGVQSQPTNPFNQPEAPSWQPPITASSPEPAPTDLSHLIPDSPTSSVVGGQSEQPVYAPPITQPETLIVPPDGNEVGPNIPTTEGGHSKIPKWVIGVGLGLLLAVTGATAYFIWPGFGNTINLTPTTDQPATTEQPATIPTPTVPTATPTPILDGSTPDGSGGGFGAVDGSANTPTPPTSAADLLRQRQQQGR